MPTHSLRLPNTSRRREPRVHVRCPVVIASGGRTTLTRTYDLSCGGACIAFEFDRASLPNGPIRLSFTPDGDEFVHLLGLTVWHLRGAYGVRFLVMTDVDRLNVAELLDQAIGSAATAA